MESYQILHLVGYLSLSSVSSVIRGLDPIKTRLAVVGDIKRSGSVVVAATPLLKKEGIKTESRLFDIPKRKDIHVVNPSMERYIKTSNYISSLVLQYVAPEDFHAYSIDELFIDATASLHLFAGTPEELAHKIIHEIYQKQDSQLPQELVLISYWLRLA